MAGLTKEQRDAKNAAETDVMSVAMFRDEPEYAGGPVLADVHADEVTRWLDQGWRVAESE
ncbi:hypothetical protein [Rahnella sp. PCH160]|uniref:hypothetical protein n=1 Tax=Rahnella sp. PCH160 TaxID=3447928 RepID=UPI0039FC3398